MTVYMANIDGQRYRMIEAVSWSDAKRYAGRAALVRRREISRETYHLALFDEALRAALWAGLL